MQPATQSYIEMRTNRRGQERPYVVGTRVQVQDIALDHERHNLSPENIARELESVSLSQVYSALAYYFDHKDEIWSSIRDDEAYAESMKNEFANSGDKAARAND